MGRKKKSALPEDVQKDVMAEPDENQSSMDVGGESVDVANEEPKGSEGDSDVPGKYRKFQ